MKIAIIGAGNFGAALGVASKRAGNQVKLFDADPARSQTYTVREAVKDAALTVIAVPSPFVRAAVDSVTRAKNRAPILIAGKGWDPKTRKMPHQMIRDAAVLGGPAIAAQIVRGVPTTVVVGSKQIKRMGPLVTKAFAGPSFCVEWSNDPMGVALGAALKNIYAIGLGILDGFGSTSNTKAMLVSGALREMCALGAALGGEEKTISGLAGLGDLIGTGFGVESRNRRYGEALAHANKKEIISFVPHAEGLRAAPIAVYFAQKKQLALPLLRIINLIISNKKSPRTLKDRLASLCVIAP